MRLRLLLSAAAAAAMILSLTVGVALAAKQDKVTICHDGYTITVGQPAVDAHQKHGDALGACA